MIESIKKFIIVGIVFLIIDLPVLKTIMKPMWENMIETIQVSPMEVNTRYPIFAYLLMTLSIVTYVLPHVSKDNILRDSILIGGTLGLIIYGIFDFTNLSIFKNYGLKVALIDILWGATLYTLTTYISKTILHKMNHVV